MQLAGGSFKKSKIHRQFYVPCRFYCFQNGKRSRCPTNIRLSFLGYKWFFTWCEKWVSDSNSKWWSSGWHESGCCSHLFSSSFVSDHCKTRIASPQFYTEWTPSSILPGLVWSPMLYVDMVRWGVSCNCC